MLRRVLVRDGIAQRRDDVADASLSSAIQDLEHDQTRPRRDARSAPAGIESIAGDDAGDVCSMAVVVVGLDRPLTKSTNWSTRCAVPVESLKSSCHDVTPESITATPTPEPS